MSNEKKKPVSAKHAAPGQAAGYLFQPERALHWLAMADADAVVGIETDDDIAVAVQSGVTQREQLKHTTSGSTPFGDRSKDLWNTLAIWLDAAANTEFEVEKCALILTTNVSLTDCFVTRLIKCNGGPRKIKKCLDGLLEPKKPYPKSIDPYVVRVKAHDPKLITKLLAKVELCDGDSAAGTSLRSKIASALHIPSDVPSDDIIDGLLGWVHFVTIENWRAQQPAWIKRSAFDNRLHRLIRDVRRYQSLGLPARMINVPADARARHTNKMYVRQLRLISAQQGEILGAIDDFYRCSSERFRLANEGDVTSDDWFDFEDDLKREWARVAQKEQRLHPEREPTVTGYVTYSESLAFQPLLSLQRPQTYLTRGSFHRLANELEIGWHPDYQGLCRSQKRQ